MTPKATRIVHLQSYIDDLKARNADDVRRYGNGVMSTTIAADIDVNLMHINNAKAEIAALAALPDETARIVTVWSDPSEDASVRVLQEVENAELRGEVMARIIATVMPSKWRRTTIQFQVSA